MSTMKIEWHFYKEKSFYVKLGIFAVLFYICWCFPLIADDWYSVGRHYSLLDMLHIIKNSYVTLNGRVLGNGFLNYFIDHKFLLCMIRCGTIFLITWLIYLSLIHIYTARQLETQMMSRHYKGFLE